MSNKINYKIVKVKNLKKGDQFSLNLGIIDIVKSIKRSKTKGYYDIKTHHDIFEVDGEMEIKYYLKPGKKSSTTKVLPKGEKPKRRSLLYKNREDVIYSVEIRQQNGKVNLEFSADCGKFGTDELLDGFELTPLELLTILQKHEDEN